MREEFSNLQSLAPVQPEISINKGPAISLKKSLSRTIFFANMEEMFFGINMPYFLLTSFKSSCDAFGLMLPNILKFVMKSNGITTN